MKDEAPIDLRQRTRAFAVRVMRLGDSLPRTRSGNVVGSQIIRSGSSVGAHYREGTRSRSDAEVISKFETALQELDETAYWLEVIVESGMMSARKVASLQKETDELIAIFVTCVKKVKARRRR